MQLQKARRSLQFQCHCIIFGRQLIKNQEKKIQNKNKLIIEKKI